MDKVYFGSYEGEFVDSPKGMRFRIFAVASEGGYILNVLLSKCEILSNAPGCLCFRIGVRHFEFLFRDHVPGLEKAIYTMKLFGFIPIFGFRGEIGTKFKMEFLEMFKRPVNKSLNSDAQKARAG